MLDEDVDPRLVQKILNRRDEFLRALVNIHPRSAAVVARQLRDAKGLEKGSSKTRSPMHSNCLAMRSPASAETTGPTGSHARRSARGRKAEAPGTTR